MYSKHRQKNSHITSATCGRLLFFLSFISLIGDLARADEKSSRKGLQRGRTVTVQWLSQGRIKREANISTQDEHPIRGEIVLSSSDLQLVLQVERNHELFGADFTETYYTDDGKPVTVTNHNYTDHCFYHGHVGGHPHSWVALSTCSGVRGLISLNSNNTFYLEPMARPGPPHHHSLQTVDQLEFNGGTCGQGYHRTVSTLSSHIANLLTAHHSRVKRSTWGTTKYMELYIVADNTLFKRQNKDYEKIKARIMEIANYVDKFYRALNIRVPLIGLEVWTDRDQCIVSEEPNATLWSFLQWRQKLKSRKKHDNAQLLTGVIFKGTTIGMAPLEGMCSLENSGGINVDHSEVSIGAAATMAHEIGHNFGMSHDHDGCCLEATADQGGCVMAAATGHPFPRVFSHCSKRDLDSYFQKGGGMCLYNMPNMKDLVGGKKCGNGFVEDGEECDCGEPDECTNDCCNANNCTLKEEAQCAHGVCCQGCKLKQAGTMCRGPAGSCDLPEYCTGASPYCPANVYLLDGSTCQYGRAYCYNGMCLTHEQQCLQLWGSGARPAHDACFEDVNAAGNAFGNCGKDEHGNYMKCAKSDAKCGKIQCHSAAKKPKGTNAVSIDTTVKTGGMEVKCRGTYVYSTQDGQGDLPDPGLVVTGTKCGEGQVCRDRRCQNASFNELEVCIARCHGNGVCNSNGNCHCNRGWAPPFCEKPGLGGSVDSGPVQYDSQVGLVVGLLFAFLVVLPAVLLLFYCYHIKTSYFHKWLTQREKNKSNKTNTSAENGKKNGHLNPAFHLKVVGPINKAGVHKGLPATSKEVLPLRPAPLPTGTQPVNVVRPLRPVPKGSRPPLPAGKPPGVTRKSPPPPPQRLSPPKKPLPLNPTRSPLLQPRPSPFPPQRPLPLSPARGASPTASPVRVMTSKPPPRLLVVMPPAGGLRPVGKVSAVPPLRALRPVPGVKPNTASPPT
ncbi:disintegrin and metalloproteinase domain-containing protein 33 isoform X1 [Nerophis ophidion]|uniref:disintegrin and metalloproteinase domain-containing protein 33 isoform X1 n=1 Tax=Nerophis ophidion TaxID=159077 RepID=UPI002AE05F96|nr:disintegrin and metalloproteinase domain-containing protein 33 isoform X1 [Nerophis ophidion]